MASVPTESLYPPLTADLIKRDLVWADNDNDYAPRPRRRKPMAENTKLFIATYFGGVVFFLTFLG